MSIYAHNLGLETLQANGKRNPVASIVIAVMIEIDAMETERLSEQIVSGLDQSRCNDTRLGQPPGTKKAKEELRATFPGVVNDLKKGLSIRHIAVVRKVSTDTVQRVKRAMPEPPTVIKTDGAD